MMPERTTPDWESTLHSVEVSIQNCLRELDQYESRFASILTAETSAPPPRTTPDDLMPHAAPDGWEARITHANARTHEIEQVLREHQEAWSRWRESFTEWQQSLQQPPGSQPPR
ncbi:MAG: hypothetical protein LC104_18605 [Bacteroidales bacterium]|nr:hypothetical protein [Bacteroidales bacterium]